MGGGAQSSCPVRYPATLPTYRFAILAGITLGMAKERDEWSTGKKGGAQERGLTHRFAVPARGPILPWGASGAGGASDLLQRHAISMP